MMKAGLRVSVKKQKKGAGASSVLHKSSRSVIHLYIDEKLRLWYNI